MGKGILLEMAGRQAVVLTPQGEFKKVPVPGGNWDIGEEIEYAEVRQQPAWLRWGTAAAAAAVLFVGSFVGWNQVSLAQPVAVVTVDINPSLELTLNKVDQVLKAEPKNADGALVLQGVDYKRKPLAEVLAAVTDRAVEEHKLNPADEASAVLVGVAPATKKELSPAQAERVVEKAKTAVTNEVARVASAQGQAPKTSVAVLTATGAERKQAEQEGLSVGKFMLMPEIQAVVPEVTPEEIRKSGPGKVLKDHNISPSEIFSKAEEKNEESHSKPSKDDEKAAPVNGTPGNNHNNNDKKNGPPGPSGQTGPAKEEPKKDDKQPGDKQGAGAEKKDDAKKADSKQEDVKKDDSKKDDAKKGDSKQGDSKQDDSQKENGKKNSSVPQGDEGESAGATPRANEPGVTAQPSADRGADQARTEPKEAPGKPEEKKADEKKVMEQKGVEKKADEKKTDEKKADEKKAEEQKKADEKKAEEQKKADEKKAEEQKNQEKKQGSEKEKNN
ncbi:MAG TPA: anti-sigma factor domain-containing protein [Symbiobacteriaceae bacterium]|nr:anti-sigma factor domain-containing protein [Symbiobacteriaceae bacterium]